MEMDRDGDKETNNKPEKMFTLKKWNLVAMWSWDVECDTCAICRVQVMGKSSLSLLKSLLASGKDSHSLILLINYSAARITLTGCISFRCISACTLL